MLNKSTRRDFPPISVRHGRPISALNRAKGGQVFSFQSISSANLDSAQKLRGEYKLLHDLVQEINSKLKGLKAGYPELAGLVQEVGVMMVDSRFDAVHLWSKRSIGSRLLRDFYLPSGSLEIPNNFLSILNEAENIVSALRGLKSGNETKTEATRNTIQAIESFLKRPNFAIGLRDDKSHLCLLQMQRFSQALPYLIAGVQEIAFEGPKVTRSSDGESVAHRGLDITDIAIGAEILRPFI